MHLQSRTWRLWATVSCRSSPAPSQVSASHSTSFAVYELLILVRDVEKSYATVYYSRVHLHREHSYSAGGGLTVDVLRKSWAIIYGDDVRGLRFWAFRVSEQGRLRPPRGEIYLPIHTYHLIPTISYRVVVGTTIAKFNSESTTFFQEFDPPDKLTEKVCSLVQLLSSAQHTVVHTGAGVSTAAGQNIHNSITYLCQFRIKIRLPAFCSR